MRRVPFIVPVVEGFKAGKVIFLRDLPGHDAEIAARIEKRDQTIDFFSRLLEMFECLGGYNEVESAAQIRIGEKITIVPFNGIAFSRQQGLQNRFVATAIIQYGQDALAGLLEDLNFFLEHLDITGVVQTVLMFPIMLDFFFIGNEIWGGNKDQPANGTLPVFSFIGGMEKIGFCIA